MNQLAMGVPLLPKTPQPKGCLSETRPFPLNVVITGLCRCSASSRDCRHMKPGAVTDDE